MCQQAADLAGRLEWLMDRHKELENVVIVLVREAGFDKHWLSQRIPYLWKHKRLDEQWMDSQ